MKRLKNIFFLLLILPLFVNAASPLKQITVQFPTQPQCNLPTHIQRLLLINRTVDNNYSDLNVDSLQNIFYKKNFHLDTVIYDLTAVDTSIQALGILLFESGRYDIVIPDNPFFEAHKNAFLSDAMTWTEVRELCKDFNADAVLSMDLFKTEVATILRRQRVYDEVNESYVAGVGAQMAVAYQSLFRIYDPKSEKILACETPEDTLYWEKSALDIHGFFNQFTSVKQALTESAINMAIDYSEKISPTWNDAERVIYEKGSDAFQQAASLASSGDWDAAIEIWQHLANQSESKNNQSKILFNLAVAYEIQGELNKAIEYANKSYETMFHQITYDYLKILAKRKNEYQKQ